MPFSTCKQFRLNANQDDLSTYYLPDSMAELTKRTRVVHMTANRESVGGVKMEIQKYYGLDGGEPDLGG